ncbi:MAG: carbohydrate ABC transporter permease, partial [Tritonibacter mobilis]|nr:carbohydrate ABC transporter permease [Tritonibacter mobilis]
MSFSVNEPSSRQKWVAGTLVILYALITLVPLIWIMMTGFKTPPDSISYPPKIVYEPSLEGYVNLFTTRTRVSKDQLEALP